LRWDKLLQVNGDICGAGEDIVIRIIFAIMPFAKIWMVFTVWVGHKIFADHDVACFVVEVCKVAVFSHGGFDHAVWVCYFIIGSGFNSLGLMQAADNIVTFFGAVDNNYNIFDSNNTIFFVHFFLL